MKLDHVFIRMYYKSILERVLQLKLVDDEVNPNLDRIAVPQKVKPEISTSEMREVGNFLNTDQIS